MRGHYLNTIHYQIVYLNKILMMVLSDRNQFYHLSFYYIDFKGIDRFCVSLDCLNLTQALTLMLIVTQTQYLIDTLTII